MSKIPDVINKLRPEYQTKWWLKIWRRKDNPSRAAKHQDSQSKNCEILKVVSVEFRFCKEQEREVVLEAQREKKKVHFATLMDIRHPKNAELEPKYQKYKGRVVLRDDIVKDDSGAYAVFTEQGSSASQMTAAKVMDVITRLPDCAGQVPDTVSAYTQIKMEDAPKLLKIPKSEFPYIWIRLPRNKWSKPWLDIEHQWFLSNEMCTDVHWRTSCDKDNSKKFYRDLDDKKCRIWNICSSKTRIVFIGIRGWHQNDLKKTEISLSCGRNGWNLLILGIQHHFLTTYTWDALNVNAIRTRSLLTNTEKCSNHEFLLEQLRHCQGERNLTQKLSRRSTKWKDMRKSALRVTSNWKIKNRAIVQSLSSLLRWSSLQEGTGISWKIVKCMLSDSHEVLVSDKNW